VDVRVKKEYAGFTIEEARKEAGMLFASIKEDWQKSKRAQLSGLLKEAEKNKDQAAVQAILKEIIELG
jgi:vacuolar-type H+-ATPase subunit H